jgi:hypothetical protein
VPPAAAVPPATREARPGLTGAELPSSPRTYRNRVFEALFVCLAEISYQRGKINCLLQEFHVPDLYLFWSFRIPAIYLRPPFRWSRPSHGGGPLTVAYHARRGPGRTGDALALPVNAVPAVTGRPPGGRQVPPLVFSAWDSATRNAATAVVNSGGSAPPAPPGPLPGDVPGDRDRRLGSTARLPRAGAGVGVPAVRRRCHRVVHTRVRGAGPWQNRSAIRRIRRYTPFGPRL